MLIHSPFYHSLSFPPRTFPSPHSLIPPTLAQAQPQSQLSTEAKITGTIPNTTAGQSSSPSTAAAPVNVIANTESDVTTNVAIAALSTGIFALVIKMGKSRSCPLLGNRTLVQIVDHSLSPTINGQARFYVQNFFLFNVSNESLLSKKWDRSTRSEFAIEKTLTRANPEIEEITNMMEAITSCNVEDNERIFRQCRNKYRHCSQDANKRNRGHLLSLLIRVSRVGRVSSFAKKITLTEREQAHAKYLITGRMNLLFTIETPPEQRPHSPTTSPVLFPDANVTFYARESEPSLHSKTTASFLKLREARNNLDLALAKLFSVMRRKTWAPKLIGTEAEQTDAEQEAFGKLAVFTLYLRHKMEIFQPQPVPQHNTPQSVNSDPSHDTAGPPATGTDRLKATHQQQPSQPQPAAFAQARAKSASTKGKFKIKYPMQDNKANPGPSDPRASRQEPFGKARKGPKSVAKGKPPRKSASLPMSMCAHECGNCAVHTFVLCKDCACDDHPSKPNFSSCLSCNNTSNIVAAVDAQLDAEESSRARVAAQNTWTTVQPEPAAKHKQVSQQAPSSKRAGPDSTSPANAATSSRTTRRKAEEQMSRGTSQVPARPNSYNSSSEWVHRRELNEAKNLSNHGNPHDLSQTPKQRPSQAVNGRGITASVQGGAQWLGSLVHQAEGNKTEIQAGKASLPHMAHTAAPTHAKTNAKPASYDPSLSSPTDTSLSPTAPAPQMPAANQWDSLLTERIRNPPNPTSKSTPAQGIAPQPAQLQPEYEDFPPLEAAAQAPTLRHATNKVNRAAREQRRLRSETVSASGPH